MLESKELKIFESKESKVPIGTCLEGQYLMDSCGSVGRDHWSFLKPETQASNHLVLAYLSTEGEEARKGKKGGAFIFNYHP